MTLQRKRTSVPDPLTDEELVKIAMAVARLNPEVFETCAVQHLSRIPQKAYDEFIETLGKFRAYFALRPQ